MTSLLTLWRSSDGGECTQVLGTDTLTLYADYAAGAGAVADDRMFGYLGLLTMCFNDELLIVIADTVMRLLLIDDEPRAFGYPSD